MSRYYNQLNNNKMFQGKGTKTKQTKKDQWEVFVNERVCYITCFHKLIFHVMKC